MKVDLKNKVALITGSASGIGRQTAKLFEFNGASVVINDIDEESGFRVIEEIRSAGGSAIFVKADVGNAAEARFLAEKTIDEFGKIDILINNAGINISMEDRAPIHEFPDEMWEKIIHVDLNGVYYCS